MKPEMRKAIVENKGCAVILAGSDSDEEHIKKIIKSLEEYEISYEVMICSAHKQTAELLQITQELNSINGAVVYIAVAGGTDALSGTLSFYTLAPVISCPPDMANTSALTNPPGSSNAVIANPKNIGKFVAQMFAFINSKYVRLIKERNAQKLTKLQANGTRINNNYVKVYEND
ncbi:AIR carboxylase family protein [bacterium]|jgi:5-(carboxyamino)imidazole ribonucleotide mutase|nr:AIR carboxylase family protein [bacterium]MBT3581932.1 AIR carboxylase family protein [bacterium]MBT4551715.1 AIR carboxylase family protein [bacterium]MBT7088687.1 AIR carboxylase family protein [bacterium]